jgi:hypothetical protein
MINLPHGITWWMLVILALFGVLVWCYSLSRWRSTTMIDTLYEIGTGLLYASTIIVPAYLFGIFKYWGPCHERMD